MESFHLRGKRRKEAANRCKWESREEFGRYRWYSDRFQLKGVNLCMEDVYKKKIFYHRGLEMSEWRWSLTFKIDKLKIEHSRKEKSYQNNKALLSVPKCVNQAEQNKRMIFQSGPASCTDEHRVGHMSKSSTALVAELQQRKTLTGWKKKKKTQVRAVIWSVLSLTALIETTLASPLLEGSE